MRMGILNSENGVSLIWMLILLVVVGILTAALLSAATFNIRFGISEVDKSRAFYAAEAGVEFTQKALQNMVVNNDIELIESLDTEKYLVSANNLDGLDYFNDTRHLKVLDGNDNLNFSVKLIENDSDLGFVSTGQAHEVIQNIEFSINKETFFDLDAPVLLKNENKDKEEHINWHGPPPHSGSYDEHDFTMDNIELVDLDPWWEFLSQENNTEEEGYIEYEVDVDNNDNIKIGYKDFQQKNLQKITGADAEKLEPNKNYFFTPDYVEIGDKVDNWVDAKEDTISQGKIVFYKDAGNYYKALQDIEDEDLLEIPPSDDDSLWIKISDEEALGDYELGGGVVIDSSVVIVNGSLNAAGNVTFRDSLVLVRNDLHISGQTKINDSLLISFNDKNNDKFLTVDGPPSYGLELTDEVIGEDWHGIKELLASSGIESRYNLALRNWRQTK